VINGSKPEHVPLHVPRGLPHVLKCGEQSDELKRMEEVCFGLQPCPLLLVCLHSPAAVAKCGLLRPPTPLCIICWQYFAKSSSSP